jgi:hypothetical protein
MSLAATLELHLATPIIVHKHMDEAEFRYEFERMKLRADATSEFVRGRLEVSDFLDALDTSGVNVDTALLDWSQGQSYLG